VLVGSKAFINEARRARKVLGGGMRQAGILAAAGIVALHEMSQRLQEDHDNAALLAEGLSEITGITVLSQNTNFIFFQLSEDAKLDSEALVKAMKAHNILISGYSQSRGNFRIVTHYWITKERVEQVIEAFKAVLS
jgi:threonine aldolase